MMGKFWILALSSVSAFALSPIQLESDGRITTSPHLADASSPRIEILDKEDCAAQNTTPSEVLLKPGCKFLRAYYRYEYKEAGETRLRVTPFSVLWNSAGSHTLLVAQSLDLLPRK